MNNITLLDAVTTSTTGAAHLVNTSKSKAYVRITGTTPSFTLTIQERVGGQWYSIHEATYSETGNMDPIYIDNPIEAIRAVTSSHSSGTVTVTLAK